MLNTLRSAARSSPRIVAPYHRLRLTRASRGYASVTDLSQYPKPGDTLHGFTLQRCQHVPELELSALHFQHDKTGADYLHVARDDQNNAFAIAFKTNPPDATGVPHILEHVTLCGSEKYPVRDPFFKMMPRSLQNYMNALTSSDHTTYPFATTNPKDFRNLMGVYLDATLHPLLKTSDFVQEGWRIGPENPKAESKNEKGSDLVFKGVVYNEMKGQVSDAAYLFYIQYMEHINPAINNSGGNPEKMTDLTYKQLKKFHQDHYHPSNSKIVTYGDQPVNGHLQFLDEILAHFDKRAVDTDIKTPEPFTGPRNIIVQGPVDPMTPPDAQYKTSVSWLAYDPCDPVESLAFQAAATILMDGYGSPMYKSLIESGLGSDFSVNTGIDQQGLRTVFSLGLNGVTKENVPKVKEAITATLNDTIAKGLEAHKVNGLLHQLELGLKHKTAKFGLGIAKRLTGSWFSGIDPFNGLEWNRVVAEFKTKFSQDGYLENLLEKYLLNDNCLTFTMEPSTEYAGQVAAEEASRLKTKIAEAIKTYSTEEEAYKDLQARELKLVEEQDAGRDESVDSLPTLRVTDIERKQKAVVTKEGSSHNEIKVQWLQTPTNGLTYFRALSLFDDLNEELRMLFPLFCDSLMRIGTKSISMGDIEDEIKLKTGGISFGHHCTTSPQDTQMVEEGVGITGYAFDRNVSALYELIQTVLLETDFDSPHAHKMIRELLTTEASGAVNGIARSGHSFAMKYAISSISPQGKLSEQIGGLTQIKLITRLAAAEENPEAMGELINKLKAIQSLTVSNLRNGRGRVAITCGSEAASNNQSALDHFLKIISNSQISIPKALNSTTWANAFPPSRRTLFSLPYQVSYSGIALPTGPYTSKSTASIAILSQLLTQKYLHPEIREKGGAYGGGAFSRGLDGIFGMYSYRDPNVDNTIKVYSDALGWAAEREWSDRELEEAKLSVFQGLDAPRSVNSEGMLRFLSGVSEEMQQERREWLLDTQASDVREAAQGLSKRVGEEASLAVLGKGFVEKREGWEVVDMGMKGKEGEEDVLDAEG